MSAHGEEVERRRVNWLSARARGSRVLLIGGREGPLEGLIAGDGKEVAAVDGIAELEREAEGFDSVVLAAPPPEGLAGLLGEARRLVRDPGGELVLTLRIGAGGDDGPERPAPLAPTLESLTESFAIARIEPLDGWLGIVARHRTEGGGAGWGAVLEALEQQVATLERRFEIERDRGAELSRKLSSAREKLARSRRKLGRAKGRADLIAGDKAAAERELALLKRSRALRLARILSGKRPVAETGRRRRGAGKGGPGTAEARPGEREPEETEAEPEAETEAEPEGEAGDERDAGAAGPARDATSANLELLFPPLAVAGRPPARPGLRVACILDQFSKRAFEPEFDYVDFGPDDWRGALEVAPPDLLLVEAAWRGVDGRWQGRLPRFERHHADDEPLTALLAWCRERDIPTVFWGKEDPPNFGRFVDHAVLFDFIFTTDEDSIPRYVERAGHDRVAPLPFAVQPRIHNPAGSLRPRPFDVAFAGSYWHGRYPERMVQMETVLGPALDFGLQIFSRPASDEQTGFPEPYASHVVGSLPYESVLSAYRRYKVFLNVNSVPGSRSMCARRIFELLACGASVVSGASPAIERLLGPGLVWESSSKTQTRDQLELLLGDDELRDREATRALRSMLAAHTYGDRVNRILSAVGIADEIPEPLVSALCVVSSDAELEAARGAVDRQSYRRVEPVIVERAGAAFGERLNDAVAKATGEYLAVIDPASHYGPAYLEDLVNVFRYTDADAAGKSAHYAALTGTVSASPGREHAQLDALEPRTLVLTRALAERLRFASAELDGVGAAFATACRELGARLYAADRFNFVAGGGETAGSEQVDV